ncbi:hypothetical protein WGM54_14195 [Paenibacillus polymyxa]|uniref:hypothetical protein n=1 Tax=Paenibacillus polymyxa TaxID=1406 RepID=UPI00307FB0F8
MTVYHGTLAGESILSSGFIKPTSKENSVYGINEDIDLGLSLLTSEGYVYLALDEAKACEFAWASMIQQRKALTGATIYIFEIHTKELAKYPDYDEVGRMNISLVDAVRQTMTYAVKDSLKIGEHVKRYKKIVVKNSDELSAIMDSGRLEQISWTEIK